MANLNLSEFGEKLFVADADHTFIWDTAGAISKRVSRNSWLSGTTADFHLGLADAASPVAQTISVQSVVAGTTNTAGVDFTIDGSQGTGTGAGGSLLFRTAAAGSSGSTQNALATALSLTAPGYVVPKTWLLQNGFSYGLEMYGSDADALSRNVNSSRRAIFNGSYLVVNSGFSIGWSLNNGAGNDGGNFGQADTILLRDAANTLALRNGANAQTFNVYGTYTSGTSYERLTLSAPSAANAIIGTNKGSGGGTARGLELQTDGVSRWSISTAGHLLTVADNTYDIGAGGANRPRYVYAGSGFAAGSTVDAPYIRCSSAGGLQMQGRFFVGSAADGNIYLTNNAVNDFGRLQFGGTTNLFPALKRSTTYLQARLADDSAFAPIQGKLTTDTAYTGTVVAATGYITIYDSTGTAYRVPCAL